MSVCGDDNAGGEEVLSQPLARKTKGLAGNFEGQTLAHHTLAGTLIHGNLRGVARQKGLQARNNKEVKGRRHRARILDGAIIPVNLQGSCMEEK